jgi:hypothetical protein
LKKWPKIFVANNLKRFVVNVEYGRNLVHFGDINLVVLTNTGTCNASSSSFQPSPSTYQPFEFPPPPPPQQQQQHFGFPSSQVELGNFVENDFLEQLTVDTDFSPDWYNSVSQLLNSDLTVHAQSSGQNSGFDLNTPVNEEEEEEEEEEPVPQLQQLRQLPHRNRQPRKCGLCGTPGHIRSKCPNVSGSSTQH